MKPSLLTLALRFGLWSTFMSCVVLIISSNEVREDLKQEIPDYEKRKDCYRKLKDHTQEAIERCRAKERQYKDFNWPSTDCNPRTDVAELVELLTK